MIATDGTPTFAHRTEMPSKFDCERDMEAALRIAAHLTERFGDIRWASKPITSRVDWLAEALAILDVIER